MKHGDDNLLKKLVTIDNYGDYVDYGIDLNGDNDFTNDWRIFYKDKNGEIFIIASQCIDATSVPTNLTGMNSERCETTYGVRWNADALPSFQMEWSACAELFMGNTYVLNGKYKSSMCTSTLLNSSNWNSFIKKDYADFAIGGPTLEMWSDSWNGNYETKVETSLGPLGYGYKINNTENINLKSDSGYNNELYFPKQSYWISSPMEWLNYSSRRDTALTCASSSREFRLL